MMDTIFIDTGVGIKVPRLDAYGIATIPQLWPAPSQLQAPPTPGAAALEAQARRDRALPGGTAIVGRGTARHTADPE